MSLQRSAPARQPEKRGRTRYGTGAPGPIRRELGAGLIAELEALCRPATVAGVLFLLGDLAAILLAAVVAYLAGNVAVSIIAIIYIGFRQRYLTNLVHECSHLKLVRSPVLNKALGHVLVTIMGESFADYQDDHRDHHGKLGRDGDPKLLNYARKGARSPRRDKIDFVVHVIGGNAVWSLPAETIRSWLSKHPLERWTTLLLRAGFWAAVFTVAAVTGTAGRVLMYWVLPLAFIRPVVNWTTDIGNHVGLMENADPVIQTRGWMSHAWTRHFLGGHMDDLYHPTHHWCQKIPFRRLPAATQLIREHYPRAAEVPWCSGFFFRRRRTPEVPCVLDDVVMRLRQRDMPSPPRYLSSAAP